MRFCRIQSTGYEELIGLITRILHESRAHNADRFDENLWLWRYTRLPGGDARIFGLYDEGRLKGYYHVPLYEGEISGRSARYAVVQDVAIDPSLRGQGRFRELAEFATAELLASDVDLIYTFPNARSIHTFLRYNGYRKVSRLPTYILPIRPGPMLEGRLHAPVLERRLGEAAGRLFERLPPRGVRGMNVIRCAVDDPAVTRLYSQFDPDARFHILRSGQYLKWRFEDQPAAEHFVFRIEAAGEEGKAEERTVAAGVFKPEPMFGARALLLMDYAYRPGGEGALRRLILEVGRNAEDHLGRPVDMVFASGESKFIRTLPRAGFIPIPAWANPRPLNLLARSARCRPGSTLCEPDFWHITLADWDVF